jgi:hypothetical protein
LIDIKHFRTEAACAHLYCFLHMTGRKEGGKEWRKEGGKEETQMSTFY